MITPDLIVDSKKAKSRISTQTMIIGFFIVIVTWLIALIIPYEIGIQSPITVKIKEQKIISPLPDETPTPTPELKIATPGAELKNKEAGESARTIKGEASYYSRSGCLGCDPNMIMANGKPLDDSALTLALTPQMVSKYKLLNDTVIVTNLKTGKSVKAKVTDTGGFGRLGRVADLSVATRDAVNCSSLCEVSIAY